jgi:hypothetical protein
MQSTYAVEHLRRILAEPENDKFSALRAQGLIPDEAGRESQEFMVGDTSTFDLGSVKVHLDPQSPHATDSGTGVFGTFASDAYVNTEGAPPYIRLPSFPEYSPYLISWFFGLTPATQYTALVDMQVYSVGGSVRISAVENPSVVLVTNAGTGGARVSVPIILTTRADGYGSLLLQRVGETGFDWLGVDLF